MCYLLAQSNNYLAIDSPVEVIFNFFLIDKDREKYYEDK